MTLLISDTRYDSLDQYSDVRTRNINDYNQRMSGELRPVRDTFTDHKAFTPLSIGLLSLSLSHQRFHLAMSTISHYSCSAICMMSLLCCLTCGGTCSLLVVYTGCSAFISSWSYSSFSSTLSYPLTSSLSLLWVYWVYWMTCSC